MSGDETVLVTWSLNPGPLLTPRRLSCLLTGQDSIQDTARPLPQGAAHKHMHDCSQDDGELVLLLRASCVRKTFSSVVGQREADQTGR